MTPRPGNTTASAAASHVRVTEQHHAEPDPANAQRFHDLAKKLVAVPKDEIDRLRKEQDARPE